MLFEVIQNFFIEINYADVYFKKALLKTFQSF